MKPLNETNTARERLITIGIIGLGPRGTAIFEQIIMHANTLPENTFHVFLFDPGKLGEGCHSADQPNSFFLNTPASEIAIVNKPNSSQTFQGWINGRSTFSEELYNNNITQHDYYPRALFGRYLSESFKSLLECCPSNLKWSHINDSVIDIKKSSCNDWELSLKDCDCVRVNYVHITTGHGVSEKNKNKFSVVQKRSKKNNHLISSDLNDIPSTHTVAVEGMGLTSFDIVSELTEGRGGHFEEKKNGFLKYTPSGNEPTIVAFSRSGLPLRAKPKSEGIYSKSIPAFLTDDVIKKLAYKSPIDFESEVLSLIILEMKHAYYKTLLKSDYKSNEKNSSIELEKHLIDLDNNLPNNLAFSLEKILNPFSLMDIKSQTTYSNSLTNHLKLDYQNACLGIHISPIKSAETILRDLREVFSKLIDFKCVTGESHRWLYKYLLPKIKHLSVGPPRFRVAQWIALIEAEVLTIDLGPNVDCKSSSNQWELKSSVWPEKKVFADTLIRARLSIQNTEKTSLIKNMVGRGHAQPFDNGGFKTSGIEVTKYFNVISSTGAVLNTVWATGMPTEGARFYTYTLPSPDRASRFTKDAETAVLSMFSHIQNSNQLTYEVA